MSGCGELPTDQTQDQASTQTAESRDMQGHYPLFNLNDLRLFRTLNLSLILVEGTP